MSVCVHEESSADYVNPAEDAAACFDEYCVQKFKKAASEHATAHADWLPDDMSTQNILASVPVYDAQTAVRSALATWAGVARVCMAKTTAYVKQHAAAHAAVFPVIDQLVRDAEHATYNTHGTSPHWCLTDPAWPPRWGIQCYGDYLLGAYWRRIMAISSRLNSYPWLALWLRGFVGVF